MTRLTAKRDKAAPLRFLRRAIDGNAAPPRSPWIDGANAAALAACNVDADDTVEMHQSKYLNNIVEQDHRFVKRKTRAALGL